MSSEQYLGRFVWRDLMTTNLAESLEFYSMLFPEWTINPIELPGAGTFNMIECGGWRMGGFVSLEGAAGIPSHWIAYVAVENCDAAVKKFEELGGRCCIPGFTVPDVGRFAVVNDAQGALIKPFEMASPPQLPKQSEVGQFCWSELLTTDASKAAEAYCAVFGWTASQVDMGESGTYTLFHCGDLEVAGALTMPPGAEAPPNWLSYFCVENVDTRTEHAVQLGAQIFVEPRDIPSVGRFSVLGDRSGATFAVYKSATNRN